MKLLYILLALIMISIGGYFVANNIKHDNHVISVILTDTLFVLIPIAIVAIAMGVFFALKRRQNDKDVMTIRQYYDYKSIR